MALWASEDVRDLTDVEREGARKSTRAGIAGVYVVRASLENLAKVIDEIDALRFADERLAMTPLVILTHVRPDVVRRHAGPIAASPGLTILRLPVSTRAFVAQRRRLRLLTLSELRTARTIIRRERARGRLGVLVHRISSVTAVAMAAAREILRSDAASWDMLDPPPSALLGLRRHWSDLRMSLGSFSDDVQHAIAKAGFTINDLSHSEVEGRLHEMLCALDVIGTASPEEPGDPREAAARVKAAVASVKSMLEQAVAAIDDDHDGERVRE